MCQVVWDLSNIPLMRGKLDGIWVINFRVHGCSLGKGMYGVKRKGRVSFFIFLFILTVIAFVG